VRGVYERVAGSGIWYAGYRVKGKLYREIAGTRTQARNLYKLRTADALQGKLPPALRNTKALTFAELAKDALEYLDTQPHRSGGDEDRIKRLVEVFANIPAESIKPSDIEGKLGEIAATRKWAPSTQNRHKAVLSLIYRRAVKNGRVALNPARLVRRLPEDNHVIRFLTPDEETKLRAVIQPKRPERWAFITLALNTGCRAGELHKLRWSEVDRTSASPQITLLKTKNKSIRYVPLNTAALAALEVLKAFDEGTGYVCPRQHYRMWFEIAMKAAKIENFRLHDIRHTFASRCTMNGVGPVTLAALLGHKSLAMVLRYSHLAPQHLASAVSGLVNFGSIHPSIHVAATHA
jgi:integrase